MSQEKCNGKTETQNPVESSALFGDLWDRMERANSSLVHRPRINGKTQPGWWLLTPNRPFKLPGRGGLATSNAAEFILESISPNDQAHRRRE